MVRALKIAGLLVLALAGAAAIIGMVAALSALIVLFLAGVA